MKTNHITTEVKKKICNVCFDRYKCRGICKDANDFLAAKREKRTK